MAAVPACRAGRAPRPSGRRGDADLWLITLSIHFFFTPQYLLLSISYAQKMHILDFLEAAKEGSLF